VGKVSLNAGDGICVITPEGVVGTNVNRVEGTLIEPNRMEGIKAGMEVYRNYDHRFTQAVERSRTRRAVDAECRVTLCGEGIKVCYTDEEGFSVDVERSMALDAAKSVDKMRSVAEEQMAKSGDSIFRITRVSVEGAEWFATAKVLAEVRREALSMLAAKRMMRTIAHDIRTDSGEARFPIERLGAEYNVVNSLSRRFYLKHGVEHIVDGLDLWSTTVGERVMESSYCLRREIGECLKKGTKLRDRLYIEHGRHRYRLDFDCAKCRMSLIDCTNNEIKR
jgi:putative protease